MYVRQSCDRSVSELAAVELFTGHGPLFFCAAHAREHVRQWIAQQYGFGWATALGTPPEELQLSPDLTVEQYLGVEQFYLREREGGRHAAHEL